MEGVAIIATIIVFTVFIAAIIVTAHIRERERRELEAAREREYRELEAVALKEVGFPNWKVIPYYDEYITVKSRQALEKYDDIKFFKENREKLGQAENIIERKNIIARH